MRYVSPLFRTAVFESGTWSAPRECGGSFPDRIVITMAESQVKFRKFQKCNVNLEFNLHNPTKNFRTQPSRTLTTFQPSTRNATRNVHRTLCSMEHIDHVPTHEWSETERGMALGLCASKRFSLREITNIIGMPKSTVSDVNKRDTGKSKPRSGRPRKVSARDMRQIIRRDGHEARRATVARTRVRARRMFGLS